MSLELRLLKIFELFVTIFFQAVAFISDSVALYYEIF